MTEINYNIIDRIAALKLELEDGTIDEIRIIIAIKNILLDVDGMSMSNIRLHLIEYYRLFNSETITLEIINSVTQNNSETNSINSLLNIWYNNMQNTNTQNTFPSITQPHINTQLDSSSIIPLQIPDLDNNYPIFHLSDTELESEIESEIESELDSDSDSDSEFGSEPDIESGYSQQDSNNSEILNNTESFYNTIDVTNIGNLNNNVGVQFNGGILDFSFNNNPSLLNLSNIPSIHSNNFNTNNLNQISTNVPSLVNLSNIPIISNEYHNTEFQSYNQFIDSILDSVVSQVNNVQVDVPIVIKEEALSKLECKKYNMLDNDLKNTNKKCMISLEDFNENDEVRVLPCKHVFSKNNIDDWLLNSSYKCPICRESAGEYYAKIN